AIGNHEFDNGVAGLVDPFLMNVSFPVLSANIKADKQLASNISGYYLPYKIFNIGEEKVGIVGYTSRETPVLSDAGPHLRFEDEVQAVQIEVDKLVALGVNKIIALGHSGFEVDKLIAKKVKGVDVVIGGHSNTFLYTGNLVFRERDIYIYIYYIMKNNKGKKNPVILCFCFCNFLNYLRVDFSAQGLLSHPPPTLVEKLSLPEYPGVLAEVNQWKIKFSNYSKQEVGKTIVYLNGSTMECRFRECNMGNLICDAMINHNIRYPDELRWTHVSICILNGGGIRGPISEQNNNGTITMEDLLSVLPFGGTFDLLKLKGSTLKAAFEHAVRRHGQSTGEFLQVSGVHVVYDLSRKPGDRVVKIEVLCSECRVPHYVPLEMNKVYKVVLPSFLATGGDGYSVLKDEQIQHDSGDLDSAVVAAYIKQRQKVYPAVEGRILFSAASTFTRISLQVYLKTALLPLLILIANLYGDY
uniref:5'-nucleotidase n=1 Tax=Latimeria chalumnae TaxID=7897 RepID=H3AKR6_LATCH